MYVYIYIYIYIYIHMCIHIMCIHTYGGATCPAAHDTRYSTLRHDGGKGIPPEESINREERRGGSGEGTENEACVRSGDGPIHI